MFKQISNVEKKPFDEAFQLVHRKRNYLSNISRIINQRPKASTSKPIISMIKENSIPKITSINPSTAEKIPTFILSFRPPLATLLLLLAFISLSIFLLINFTSILSFIDGAAARTWVSLITFNAAAALFIAALASLSSIEPTYVSEFEAKASEYVDKLDDPDGFTKE